MGAPEPIVAIATAAGRGGIGIVRLSGGDLSRVLPALFDRPTPPRVATWGHVLDAQAQPIDEGLALYFPAPHSYTGESVLELQVHGGPVVLQLVLARCLQAAAQHEPPADQELKPRPAARALLPGLRLARPGEFTERAYLNGRLDLAQAEAVADLIDASTEAAARSASRSLQGAFSRQVQGLRDELEALRVLVEASLDFPEEDLDFVRAADCEGRIQAMQATLSTVLASATQGRLLRDGLSVALVGQPNVGKSSLLNALAGAELAIVTPIAGTTRDRVRETIAVRGMPLHIIDTAGLRDSEDPIERLGVARSWESVAEADVVVVVHDLERLGDAAWQREQAAIEARLAATALRGQRLDVGNKRDRWPARVGSPPAGWITVSAQTGAGLDALRQALADVAGWQAAPEGVFIARERHLAALHEAADGLALAQQRLHADAAGSAPALDLLAEDLRAAHVALGRITGQTSADELLGLIFSRFCIGK